MPETKVDWPKLMEEALTAPGNLGNTYSRFHDYSITNELLFLMQGLHEPVASYSRWKSLGRQVVRGARASEVIVPVLVNEQPPEDETEEEKRERVARLIGFKVVRAVFPLSATEGDALPEVPTPGWDLQTALGKLGIREIPFDSTNGNLQGYSHGLEFAINPIAVKRDKTIFHELGHIVLGHTLPHRADGESYHRGIMEFQAEATAYLVENELGLLDEETARHSRGYMTLVRRGAAARQGHPASVSSCGRYHKGGESHGAHTMNELNELDLRVLRLIHERKSDKRIAEELGISRGAAIFHRWRLLKYYGVKTGTELRKVTEWQTKVNY